MVVIWIYRHTHIIIHIYMYNYMYLLHTHAHAHIINIYIYITHFLAHTLLYGYSIHPYIGIYHVMIYLVGGFICSHIFVLFCLLGSEPADLRSGLRRAHSPGIGFRGWSFCTSSFSCRCLEMALNNHNMELFALPALGSFGAAGWGCWGCLSVGKKSHAALEG